MAQTGRRAAERGGAMVTRFTLLKELAVIVPDEVLVLTSIGNNSGFWGQLKEREANLFHLTMGMCSSTALGLALALPNRKIVAVDSDGNLDRKSTRLNSSHSQISYAVFCL